MKKSLIVAAVIALIMVSFATAAETQSTPQVNQDNQLTGSVDLTYLTQFVWRGFTVFGGQDAFQPAINLDFWKTGFGAQIQYSVANGTGDDDAPGVGYNQRKWIRNYLFYDNVLAPGECMQTNYRIGYMYYNFPANSHDYIDLQELHMALAWPKVLGVEGLVPSYILVKLWPAWGSQMNGSESPSDGTASGFAHVFGLDYAMPMTSPFTGEASALNLHAETIYNDGVGPMGQNVDHDWSNAVFGVSTDFNVAENMIFTPGVFHQVTMDSSVNDDKDITWATANLKIKF
jgi:opacity protein-like surface antigen